MISFSPLSVNLACSGYYINFVDEGQKRIMAYHGSVTELQPGSEEWGSYEERMNYASITFK